MHTLLNLCTYEAIYLKVAPPNAELVQRAFKELSRWRTKANE